MVALEKISDTLLRNALEDRREALNAAFRAHQRTHPNLTAQDMYDVIRTLFPPITTTLMGAERAAVARVVEALFRAALILVPEDHLASGVVREVWQRLLPRAAPLLHVEPVQLPAVLTNAALHLERDAPDIAGAWLSRFEKMIGALKTLDQIRDAGRAVAWMSGRADWRREGIAALKRLPAEAVACAIGEAGSADPSGLSARVAAIEQDLWESNLRGARLAYVLGGWAGFGGPFVERPLVFRAEETLYVRAVDRVWEICADQFGARLVPTDAPVVPASRPSTDFLINENGRACWGTMSVPLGLSGVRSQAFVGRTLAASLERSYQVAIVARDASHG